MAIYYIFVLMFDNANDYKTQIAIAEYGFYTRGCNGREH